jgi:hypothetical protein
MKKIIIIFSLVLGFQAGATAQCGINYKEILARYCEGEYLKHQELNNESGAAASLILEKDNRYAIYLLNPNFSVPSLKWEGVNDNSFKDYSTEFHPEENFSSHIFTATETGEYHFSLDFGDEKKACILMAIYLQNDEGLTRGIYKNFEELQNNKPTIAFNYQISSRFRKKGSTGFEKIPFYRINIGRGQGRSIGRVFGFCDGKNIFINEDYPRLGPKTEFVQLENLGRYYYFETIRATTIFVGTVPVTTYDPVSKIMDAYTGEIIVLRIKTLEDIIVNDPDLLAEFQNDPKKGRKLKEYLIRYLDKQE